MSTTSKAANRSILDGSWQAVEAWIEDTVEDVADVAPLVEVIRSLVTAERMLADQPVPGDDFAELVERIREQRKR